MRKVNGSRPACILAGYHARETHYLPQYRDNRVFGWYGIKEIAWRTAFLRSISTMLSLVSKTVSDLNNDEGSNQVSRHLTRQSSVWKQEKGTYRNLLRNTA